MAKLDSDSLAHTATEQHHFTLTRRYWKVVVYLLISCLLTALSYPIYQLASRQAALLLGAGERLHETTSSLTRSMLYPAATMTAIDEDQPKQRVYMTYYSTHAKASTPGYDFNATRILIFRLLYHPQTSGLHEIVVLITPSVPEWQARRFSDDGAIVRKIDFLAIPGLTGGRERWADSFSRLTLFNMTEYERIVYLDANLLVLRNLDLLFDIPRNDGEASLRPSAIDEPGYPYHFAASVDVGGPEHDYDSALFDTGLMIVDPSRYHFERLLSLAPQTHLYNTTKREQGLLNYAYSFNGPFPYQRLPYIYNGQYANPDVLPQLYTIHSEFWQHDDEGSEAFWRAYGQVEAYHDF